MSTIRIDASGLRNVHRQLMALAAIGPTFFTPLLEEVGGEIVAQIKLRISEEKTTPEGKDWPSWSIDYDKRAKGTQSLLEKEGALLNSIQHIVEGESLEVGSNLVYSNVHQFGHTFTHVPAKVPAREYLGISQENESDIFEIISDHVKGLLT